MFTDEEIAPRVFLSDLIKTVKENIKFVQSDQNGVIWHLELRWNWTDVGTVLCLASNVCIMFTFQPFRKRELYKTSSMFQSSFVFSGHFPKTGRIHPLGTSLELILLPISSVLETILRWKLGKSGFIIEHFPCKNILKKTKSEIYLWSYFNA